VLGGSCGTYGKKINAYRLVGKPVASRPLVRSRHRWEEILKWILKKWVRMGWINLAEHGDKWRVVNMVMNLQVQ
jgi:hypothetical protein